MEHRADLPSSPSSLSPLDQSKLHLLQIMEWFQTHDLTNKSDPLSPKLMDWLKSFNPEEQLRNNVWLKRVRDTRDFRMLIRRIKKEPEFAEYFESVVKTKGQRVSDGYNSYLDNEMDGEIEADSLFLEDDDKAYRVLGIKSPFKCVDCQATNCGTIPASPPVSTSTSPQILAKLFSRLRQEDEDLALDNILILGSGIGSVTFCTHLFAQGSKKSRIISWEWDVKQYELQRSVVQRQKGMMQDRVTVINGFPPADGENDIVGLIKSMDLVIACERLLSCEDIKEQREGIFMRLQKCMKSGARLVLYRKLSDWIRIGGFPSEMEDWLGLEYGINRRGYTEEEDDQEEEEEDLNYYVYKVL